MQNELQKTREYETMRAAMHSNDTIAAVATPPGTGAIAVIRMSGPQATAVLQACTGKVTAPRHATLARVHDARGRVVDEVVVTRFVAPASYTGEDVVEVSCHGGMLVTRRVLERLLECGAFFARSTAPWSFATTTFMSSPLIYCFLESLSGTFPLPPRLSYGFQE